MKASCAGGGYSDRHTLEEHQQGLIVCLHGEQRPGSECYRAVGMQCCKPVVPFSVCTLEAKLGKIGKLDELDKQLKLGKL